MASTIAGGFPFMATRFNRQNRATKKERTGWTTPAKEEEIEEEEIEEEEEEEEEEERGRGIKIIPSINGQCPY